MMIRVFKKNKIIFKLFNVLILILLLPLTLFLFNNQTNYLSKAYLDIIGKRANLIVDLIGIHGKNFVQTDLAQGGEEKGEMFKNVIQEVKNLEPNYIRIDHIYDFYDVVYKDGEDNLQYNWSKLDEEIGDILETGAKPFLSLSYMPGVISSGSETDVPVNWEEWQMVVKSTIEHLSGTTNLGISDVYYEVWNEPDLFGEFKIGKGKDYLLLYRYAALGANEAQEVYPFKFGGPSTTGLYKNWFDRLLTFAKNNGLKLDFYSWHRYSEHLGDFENDLKNASEWLKNHPQYENLEFVISETGFDTEINPKYDKKFSAIHNLALYTLVSSIGLKEDLKVFTFEIKDGPGEGQYWGRWGILTHEKFGQPMTKPRYEAIDFYNMMRGTVTPVYGQGSWVRAISVKNADGFKLLVVNYDPFDKHYENVPIMFVGLPTNKFIYRRTEFLGETVEFPVENTSNSWKVEVIMKPNSAMIIEIIPVE